MADLSGALPQNDISDRLLARLEEVVPDVGGDRCNSNEALPELIGCIRPDADCSVRIDGSPGCPTAKFFGKTGPRWVVTRGVGTDHFGKWNPGQIGVTNFARITAEMMAEYAIPAFRQFTLGLPRLQGARAAREWATRTA